MAIVGVVSSGSAAPASLAGHAPPERGGAERDVEGPALDVLRPGLMGVFYAVWCGVNVCRALQTVLAILRSRALDPAVIQTVAMVGRLERVGLALAGVESIGTLAGLVSAWRVRMAAREEADRLAGTGGEARRRLCAYRAWQQESRQARASLLGLPGADRRSHGARAPVAAAPRRPLPLRPVLRPELCDDYLLGLTAQANQRDAHAGLRNSGLACLRDVCIQGALATLAGLEKLQRLLLPVPVAQLAPWTLSLCMSGVQVVAGALELRSARSMVRTRRRLLARVERLLARPAEMGAGTAPGKRAERLGRPLAAAALNCFADTQRQGIQRALRLQTAALLRLAHGGLGVACGMAVIGAAAFFGISVLLGPFGVMVGLVALAGGCFWLACAPPELLKSAWSSWRAGLQLPPAAESPLPGAGEPVDVLEPAARRYLLAAVLARSLRIAQDDGELARRDRLSSSAVLQFLGMPRDVTSMLKRASFEVAHQTIDEFLREGGKLEPLHDDASDSQSDLAPSATLRPPPAQPASMSRTSM